jgi:hypothetical protein
MDASIDERDSTTAVAWRRLPATEISSPIVRRLPYLEVKLEHAGIEATARGDRFFPDVVPYRLDGTARIFYWRHALAPTAGNPAEWTVTSASTHELFGIESFPSELPPLVSNAGNAVTIVVDGTVGGETTTALVEAYDSPTVRIDRADESTTTVTVNEQSYTIETGQRRRMTLPNRDLEPIDSDDGPTTVTPELVVRYPGRRELHHPAPGADYRLFPSFGLDLDELPNPLPVPTTAGELDHEALGRSLGVDLSKRPYPERVLWQAFAYTAFDPHGERGATLTKPDDEHIILLPPAAESD